MDALERIGGERVGASASGARSRRTALSSVNCVGRLMPSGVRGFSSGSIIVHLHSGLELSLSPWADDSTLAQG